MTKQDLQTIAINQVGFEYFQNCIKNGSTAEQAKAEMMTPKAQAIILKRVSEIL